MTRRRSRWHAFEVAWVRPIAEVSGMFAIGVLLAALLDLLLRWLGVR